MTIESRYTLTIHNDTPHTLHGVTLTGGGVDLTLGDIPPGDRASRWFWIERDGALTLRTAGHTPREIVVDQYVSTGIMGMHRRVTVHADGGVTVDPPTDVNRGVWD